MISNRSQQRQLKRRYQHYSQQAINLLLCSLLHVQNVVQEREKRVFGLSVITRCCYITLTHTSYTNWCYTNFSYDSVQAL